MPVRRHCWQIIVVVFACIDRRSFCSYSSRPSGSRTQWLMLLSGVELETAGWNLMPSRMVTWLIFRIW